MSFYLSHESNNAFHALTTAPKLQIKNSNPRGKIVQNVKFSPVSQNNYLSSKLNFTRQNKSESMLSFQNKAPKTNKPKSHTKRWNKGLPQKMHLFYLYFVWQFWDRRWIRGIKTSPRVFLVSNWSPGYSYMQNEANFNW